jgi:mono/diheme cytochrome c family protein
MKKTLIITGCMTAAVVLLVSCGGPRRDPGHAYMPDMTYSRAYETYAPAEERLKNSEASSQPQFNGQPVAGTVARGELAAYRLKNDTSGYAQSVSVHSPLDLATIDMKEAERLYLVNCGVCHGAALDGNGPLYNNGNGPFLAAPKNLMGEDMKAQPEGQTFHVVTFGKGAMGSYASQLTSKQRWMVVAYVKSKQHGGAAPAATSDSTGTKPAGADSTATAKAK